MENVSKYKLTHIDTLESVICKKYTVGGFDYYVKSDTELDTSKGIFNLFYHVLDNTIATTNNTLDFCPQVIDYVEYLANEYLSIRCQKYQNTLEEERLLKTGFIDGFYQHKESHSFSDEEIIQFAKYELQNDIVSYEKSLEQFKSTLPIKIYYK